MTDNLNLIIGKPSLKEATKESTEKIATFTRFVLPFSFRLQSIASDVNFDKSLYFEQKNVTSLSFIKRRKYFTRETAETLYDRAQWLSACSHWDQTEWGKGNIEVILRDQSFKIGMLPPQIVLFELPEIQPQHKTNILQTGFLFVDVYFNETQDNKPQLDDLLVLNEFFRFFGIPYDNHASIFKKIFAKVPSTIDGSKTIGELDELKCYFERWASLLEIPLQSNDQYYRFSPQTWTDAARKWMYNELIDNHTDHWQIYADNRCYVWTVAILDEGAKNLKLCFEPHKNALNAVDYGHWVKLVNADCPPFDFACKKYKPPHNTHQAITTFERKWIESRTYLRWQEEGSWYGFCYHGAATLAPPMGNVFTPVSTYYFDTTLLLLYIRMALFRFGRELSRALPEEGKPDDRAKEKLRNLRRLFSRFTVLYRFPMLSNQQQHIEMYEINRKHHDIDQFFDEIQKEVDNTHQFLETVEANQLAHAANRLANWGIPIAACGLVAALFSMVDLKIWQCLSQDCQANENLIFQAAVVMGLLFVLVLPFILKWFKNKIKN